MTGIHLARLTGSKRSLFALLASSALFTAGCSNMLTTAPASAPLNAAQSISGKVHGGSQPVSGATATLYFAGQNTPAVEAAKTTTDSTGAFSFTKNATAGQAENGNIYSCPGGPSQIDTNPLVYVIVRGGNTVNDGISTDVNSAAAFIGLFGLCDQISAANTLVLNELTTTATMLAVAQYFDPVTEALASDGSGAAKIAIDNTINTIANMVNTTTGTSVTSTTTSGINGGSNVSVTVTPESSKINLIANIITACVNNTSSTAANCNTLFSNAVPPLPAVTNYPDDTFATAKDVLQALDYMFTNPTGGGSTNIGNLFGLASAGAAYQPSLSTQPTDWTVAISYTSSSACGLGGGTPSTLGGFFSSPNALTIDLDGNVWVGNGQASNGNLVSLTPNGIATGCFTPAAGTSTANGAVFIDSSGNVWSALAGASHLSRLNPASQASLTFNAAGHVLAITGDGVGNVYFSTPTGLYEIAGGATVSSSSTPSLISSGVLNATSLFPDTNGFIWASSGTGLLGQINPSVTPAVVKAFTTDNATRAVTVTATSNVFVSAVTPGNDITYFALNGSLGYQPQPGWPTTASLGGINQPSGIAIDGAANVWSANSVANSNGLFGISEISLAGTPLSPDTASGGFQKSSSYLNASSSVVVDQSGNVWIAGGSASNNFITELVGAGVPIFQPYAMGLVPITSRFQSKP